MATRYIGTAGIATIGTEDEIAVYLSTWHTLGYQIFQGALPLFQSSSSMFFSFSVSMQDQKP
jgi:hypothetical protein